jgi:hypothetical protein
VKLTHADLQGSYYLAPCPNCGLNLEWGAEYPPIPMDVFRWFEDGKPISFCPRCDHELPSGDIRIGTGAIA